MDNDHKSDLVKFEKNWMGKLAFKLKLFVEVSGNFNLPYIGKVKFLSDKY